ncbi:MAG: DUF3540 domain-containing protein [Comamonadaceae bacterium]|nr:MAG: DUF3540 domain-containing protein [Comamonadaceae bacterium]
MGAADPIHAVLRYPPVQVLGSVVRIDADTQQYAVQCDGHIWHAHRAVSCLVTPAINDEVLLSGPSAQQVFLIAVVRQHDGASTRIDVQGDLQIAAVGGEVCVQADTVALRGAREVSLTGLELTARADRAGFTFKTLDYVGEQARVGVDRISVVGRVCEVVMDRLSQLANSVFRLTRDTEQSRAGRIDLQAEHTLRLHAEHTLVTAKDLVKVDANQIHMG